MKKQISLAECWLWLGVTSLAVAGLYSLVPVIGRTPQFKSLPVMQRFFDVALVVHVDLSVLIWFLSMLGMNMVLLMEHYVIWPYWLKSGWVVTALSALLIALSPLGEWVPVKSNYIPVLHNLCFMLALGLLVAGMLLTLIPFVVIYKRGPDIRSLNVIGMGWVFAALAAMLALVGFSQTVDFLPPKTDLVAYYEALFWVSGHILQFCFTLMAMASWLTLVNAMGLELPQPRWVIAAYVISIGGAFFCLGRPFINASDIPELTQLQTRIMTDIGGVGPTIVALLVIGKLLKGKFTRANRVYAACLIVSLVLFFFGGVLGLMIQGQNVTIPAHYHGMIVGITVALMGLAYFVLPLFGYRTVANNRMAFLQPIIYGVGQLMHIGGLAYCGGYGILRKTAGGFEQLAPDIKVALGIFGFGGLLAITGGILFVIIMVRASVSPQQPLL